MTNAAGGQAATKPDIIVDKPDISGPAVSSPLDITVRFVSAGPAIDRATFKISAKVLFAWVDITKEVREKAIITAEGVKATGVEAPKGKFKLRVEVADVAGGRAKREAEIKVV